MKKKTLEFRPIDYQNVTKDDLLRLEQIAFRGVPIADAATAVGLTPYELLLLVQRFPSVKKNYDRKAMALHLHISEALINKALEGNVQAIKWFEQSRYGLSEKPPETRIVQQYINEFLSYLKQSLPSEIATAVEDAAERYDNERL